MILNKALKLIYNFQLLFCLYMDKFNCTLNQCYTDKQCLLTHIYIYYAMLGNNISHAITIKWVDLILFCR